MEPWLLFVAGVIASILGFISAWQWRRIDALEKKNHALEVKLAEQYVSNRQLDAVVARFDQRFDRVEQLLMFKRMTQEPG